MEVTKRASVLLALAGLSVVGCGERKATDTSLVYPAAERGPVVDDYHGTSVADPYRWMEEVKSPAVSDWVEAQNAVSRPYLESIDARDKLIGRLTELWDYERVERPRKYGDRYFFMRNTGTLDHSILFVSDEPAEAGTIVLDPNSFSADATVALSSFSISPDGSLVAYATSDGGTDWDVWRVRDVAAKKDLADTISGTKFTDASWLPDSSGFFYSRYPRNPDGSYDDQQQVRVYYHEIGTPTDMDRIVYAVTGNESQNPYAEVTDDGRYLVVTLQDGWNTNEMHYRDLAEQGGEFTPVFDEHNGYYTLLGNNGTVLYFETTLDAPRGRVIAVDVSGSPGREPESIVPQHELAMQSASLIGDQIIVSYLRDVKSQVQRYGTDGEFRGDVQLPASGTATGFARGSDESETFFSFSTFTAPPTVHRLDLESGAASVVRTPAFDVDADDFTTQQVFYNSSDGTLVPMYIIHRKDIKLDGNQPTLLYGYGGFNVSLTPSFSVPRIVWLEMGGVLAIPNLRGGGEYGKAWHRAGTKLEKQNVFDDFVAAAEWLIANDYTNPKRLATTGRSNGGLLVGATMIQRPDLFAATLPAVGLLDMLRYHTASANAKQWSSDYGLSSDKGEFGAQFAYSPYHNVKAGTCYPPTLVTTANLDDRVVPWHSYKFGAALQYAQSCANPILVRVETRAGHGAGKPKWMQIEDFADQWAFLARHLNMTL